MLSAMLLMMMWAQQPTAELKSPKFVEAPIVFVDGRGNFSSVEPFDVPAVHRDGEWDYCNPENVGTKNCFSPPHWTCKDKRRVLLTAENGERHCVLLAGSER